MIETKHLTQLLRKSAIVRDVYDRQMDKLAKKHGGRYQLDEYNQLRCANDAFNIVLKESTINVSWEECQAIFDIMDRGD